MKKKGEKRRKKSVYNRTEIIALLWPLFEKWGGRIPLHGIAPEFLKLTP